jgi:hypothetical protein
MKTPQTKNPTTGKAAKLTLSIVIASLLVVTSYFSSFLNQATQPLFAAIFTLGVLSIGTSESALLITVIGGVAYSFVSPRLGFLMLLPWVVRGVTTFLVLKGTQALKQRSQPSAIKVTAAMTLGSLLTGVSQYFWLAKILHVIPDTTAILALTETAIITAVVSTLIMSFVTTKYLFKRIKPVLPW